MPAPISKLKKVDLIRLARQRCVAHRHSYLDHWQCYLRECPQPPPERVGYFDIETSHLKADYGQLLSWAIKDGGSDTIYYDAISLEDIQKGVEDKRIIKSCVQTLREFDKIVTYYGSGFDFPFVRTRALIMGVDFPGYGEIQHKDAYMLARSKINLSSRRLENACRQILGRAAKTRIEPHHWRGSMRGDPDAIAYVVDHNIKDVLDLEQLWLKLEKFQKGTRTSI